MNGWRDNPPHTRVRDNEVEVPEIMLDYGFIRRDDEVDTITILMMKDRQSRAVRAWVVPHKGADLEGTVDCAVQGITEMGTRGES